MTDHLAAARRCIEERRGFILSDKARLELLEAAVSHVLDHFETQQAPAPDPLDESNRADRYDRDGDRWEWCDRCGGFRMARYHYGKPKRHLGLSVAMLDEDCGPLTFAPQPADTPTTAPQPEQAHGDAAEPNKPKLNVQIESWTAIYDGGEIVSSAGFSAWLEAHDAELREQIAGEIEALPNLSIRSFGTRPLPDLIRKDTATRIARGEQL